MEIIKLERAGGFLAVDLDGAPAIGVTRLAPKVLQEGAELLARSLTYLFASYGLQMSGGSAGINAKPDDRDAAIAGYVDDVSPLVGEGRWRTWPGTGLSSDDLAPVAGDGPALQDDALSAQGVTAAAVVALEGASGAKASIAASGPTAEATAAAATDAGLEVMSTDLDAECDVLFVGGKAGVIDHDVAATVRAKVVVPLSPVPVTAKAYAVLSRAGTVYVPDFLALAAPLLAALDPSGGDPVERVRERTAKAAAHGVDAWRAAVDDADAFLTTWRDAVPFGRPLA